MIQFTERGPHFLFVAETRGVICGYACSTRLRSRPAYDISVEATVYLDASVTGRGIGRVLYTRLLGALQETRVHRIFAAISLPNQPSIQLHEALGYRHVGAWGQVGFKFGRYWDVAWFERPLDSNSPPVEAC